MKITDFENIIIITI